MDYWATPTHLSPTAILRAVNEGADYKYYDADKMGLVCEEEGQEGQVDWCNLVDVTFDEHRIMLDEAFVRYGLIEVDKPMKEGRGMFIASHHSEVLSYVAYPAAKAGLWWHIKARNHDFEKSLEMYRKMLTHSTMSQKVREEINGYVAQWREMFPGDSRVEDFHTDFVLDMLLRQRVWRAPRDGLPKEVYYDRAGDVK